MRSSLSLRSPGHVPRGSGPCGRRRDHQRSADCGADNDVRQHTHTYRGAGGRARHLALTQLSNNSLVDFTVEFTLHMLRSASPSILFNLHRGLNNDFILSNITGYKTSISDRKSFSEVKMGRDSPISKRTTKKKKEKTH